jgi:hypothetical protein
MGWQRGSSVGQGLIMSNPHAHCHAVHFYGDDRAWCRTVAGFIADGVRHREAVIVVVTPLHRALILEQLLRLAVPVGELLRTQALRLLDASETLRLFMTASGPDGELFRRHVGGTIRATAEARSPGRVRAYGEMVDLLAQEGRLDHALRLEQLWNQVAASLDLSLLCGYAKRSFAKEIPPTDLLVQHTHLLDSTGEVSAVPVATA